MNGAVELTPQLLRSMPLPLAGGGDKEQRGRTLVVGGDREVPGAVLLAGVAALRAGAGKLQIATPHGVAQQLALAVPEARVIGLPETTSGGISPDGAALLRDLLERCGAALVGPGMLDEKAAAALVAGLLAGAEGPAFLFDAGALAGLREQATALRRRGGRVVVTPHAGEMAGLLGMTKEAVEAAPLATARKAAAALHAVVALKGATTWIVEPGGRAWVNRHGNGGLGTAGSGDVLSGLIAGLMARGATPAEATLWGVHAHAEAGERLARRVGLLGYLAREIAAEVPRILEELSTGSAGPPGAPPPAPPDLS